MLDSVFMVVFLFVLALLSSTLGTLIGAGGGFILTPLLVLLGFSPVEAVGTGLVMVLTSSVSASFVFHRQGRLSLKHGVILGMLTLPGAFVGSWVLTMLDVQLFKVVFGLSLALISAYMIVKRRNDAADEMLYKSPSVLFQNNYRSLVIPPVAGFVAAMFGIGGGILMAPALIYLADIPTHIATATSKFIALFSSFFALSMLLSYGLLNMVLLPTIAAAGLIGGQIGAVVSKHVKARMIKTIIAAAILTVSINILVRTLL